MNALFERLLARTVELEASDLFLKVGQPPNVRVNGELTTLDVEPLTPAVLEEFLALVLTPPQFKRFATHPDLDVAFLSEAGERYRVNCFRQRGQVGMAIRWVRGGDLSLGHLHLPPVLAEWAERRHGLVIVAGATGTGKSTTLSAIVELMNRGRRRHIVTIEDPIEFLYVDGTCLIEQREVGYDTNSFADALRHVVRQSPDAILIGEMRDLDTMRVALSAALTGHLVLTTLHTTDALSTIERLLHYFPPEQQHVVRVELAQSLVGVLCQRLVPSATGTGRVPATELLTATPLVTKYLQEGDTAGLAKLLHSGRTTDVESFERSLTRLVTEGAITRESALAHSTNPTDLDLHLQGLYSGSASLPRAEKRPGGAAAPAAGTPETAARRGQPETDTPPDDGPAPDEPPSAPEPESTPPAEPEDGTRRRYTLL